MPIGGAEISLAGVRRQFGAVTAVADASLSVRSGEFFTLLGPSGSGKTTLLHLLAGFQEPDAGEIRLDERTVSGLPPFKRDIGVVFQSYALFPNMSVAENVAFPLRVRRIARAEVERRVTTALDLVQLTGFGERHVHQLSGGQQQRVALARAFVFEPRLLLMDEPLSALDAKLRRAMRLEIKELQRKLGVTVIYVTHDQDEALALSDRVAVMNRGLIEQIDSPDRLYERPASRFVADFLGEANLIEASGARTAGEGMIEVSAGPHLLRVNGREGGQSLEVIAIAIRPERIVVEPSEPLANSLCGEVVSSLYGGDHVMLRVDLGAGTVLSVKRQLDDRTPPAVGASVTLGFAAEHAIALAR